MTEQYIKEYKLIYGYDPRQVIGENVNKFPAKKKRKKMLSESLTIDLVPYDGEQDGGRFTLEDSPYDVPTYRGDYESSAWFQNSTSLGLDKDDYPKVFKKLKGYKEFNGLNSPIENIDLERITVSFEFDWDWDGDDPKEGSVVMTAYVHSKVTLEDENGNRESDLEIEDITNDKKTQEYIFSLAFEAIMGVFDYYYSDIGNEAYQIS